MATDRHRPHHRTVDRVVELLGAATTDPHGLSLTRLARAVDAPVSSVQKLVYGLVATGLLNEKDGRYSIGPAAGVLAHRGGAQVADAPDAARLVRLHEQTGAAALSTTRVGDDAVNLFSIGLPDSLAFTDARRWRYPLHTTAGGRVLAAHLPEARRLTWAGEVCEDDAAAARLLDELQWIRERGVARGAGGPLRPDLEAVAVPVWHDGAVMSSVSLARPEGASDVASPDELEAALRRAYPAPR